MINEKIVTALKPLGIPAHYQKVKQKTNKYIMFSIYKRKPDNHVDNKSLSDTYYVTLKFYFIAPKDLSLMEEIIDIMKINGFGFDGESDLITDSDYYGKEIDFIINITKEND